MKVFDLHCRQGHDFEGWFASEDDFQSQQSRGLMVCPMCNDATVTKRPSAPRLNLSGASAPSATAAPAQALVRPGDLQATWLQAVRQLMNDTEDVGPRFAEEARRIHYGETEQRGIRGQASPEERQALLDEGIETVSIPLPAALKGPVQ